MKLNLSVDFDSLEEYLEFFTVLQKHFGDKMAKPETKATIAPKAVSPPKVQEELVPSKPKTPVVPKAESLPEIQELEQPALPKVPGFRPSVTFLSKVNAYIEQGHDRRPKIRSS